MGSNKILITVMALGLLPLLFSCQSKSKKKKVVVTPEMLIEHNKKLVGLEADIIRHHLEKDSIVMSQSQTGLWYRVLADSVGTSVKKNDRVHLIYRTSLLDGTECYSSDRNGIWTIVVGKDDIEAGLEEVLMFSSEGDSIQFITPPYLAHGITGDGNRIPGNSILDYSIKILKIETLQ